MTPFLWSADHVAAIDRRSHPTAPIIMRDQAMPVIPGIDLWDHWPVLEENGALADVAGGTLVIALSAPVVGDPEARHGIARLRLLHRRGAGAWRDLGRLLPDGFSPGSREWAGSAILSPDHRQLTLHFTAAGIRAEAVPSFAQRLFVTHAPIAINGDDIVIGDWSAPVETVAPDALDYETDMAGGGAIGTIKAFRDPYVFRDPADGVDYLFFAASRARAGSDWNGLVGMARRVDEGWALMPPLVDATGLNNELERPHCVVANGRYHLFWSTQSKVFAKSGPSGPNGLYGLVADRFDGAWRPINGSGLVLANPPEAPFQAYSWQVLPDLSVWSFADMLELDRPPGDAAEARAHFGGTPAPVLHLAIENDRVVLVSGT